MIILDCEQYTPQWWAARIGIPTASGFSKILSPTGKKSTQASAYMNALLAEWLANKSFDDEFSSDWMNRGKEVEDEAKSFFEMKTGIDLSSVGLIYKNDKLLVSCSPDAINDETGLEIKCPKHNTHIGYLLKNELPLTYKPQVQGSMYVTGFDHWHFIAYHPSFDPLIVKVDRDNEYIAKLDESLNAFIDEMLEKREQLTQQKKAA